MNREAFLSACRSLNLELSEAQLGAFERFEAELYAANETRNLTRIPKEESWLRQFVDCLLFHDLIPEGARVLDIGSGPGFPAWPLACARPDLTVTALDSSGKMLGFLMEQPLSNLIPVLDRAETWGEREAFDVVTGRAVAPLSIQLELSAPASAVGGCVIPMRTENDLPEIERLRENPLGLELERVERRILPVLEAPRVFPVFRKTGRTPKNFPREWAAIRKKPI